MVIGTDIMVNHYILIDFKQKQTHLTIENEILMFPFGEKPEKQHSLSLKHETIAQRPLAGRDMSTPS